MSDDKRLVEPIDVAKAQVKAGWCQRALQNDDGEVCLMGALFIATGSTFSPSGCAYNVTELGVRMASAISNFTCRTVGMMPVAWNNTDGRTQAEVVELLEEFGKSPEYQEAMRNYTL